MKSCHQCLEKKGIIYIVNLFCREDDNDKSDSDDEPVSFSVNNREKELRNIQSTILAAQEGIDGSNFTLPSCRPICVWWIHRFGLNECFVLLRIFHSFVNKLLSAFVESDNDQDKEWEEQQIRKGTSMPQVLIKLINAEKYCIDILLGGADFKKIPTTETKTVSTGARSACATARILWRLPAVHVQYSDAFNIQPYGASVQRGELLENFIGTAFSSDEPREETRIATIRRTSSGHNWTGQKETERQVLFSIWIARKKLFIHF